jgi:hypothetical protein
VIGVIGFDNLIQRKKDRFSFAVTKFGDAVGIIHAVTDMINAALFKAFIPEVVTF